MVYAESLIKMYLPEFDLVWFYDPDTAGTALRGGTIRISTVILKSFELLELVVLHEISHVLAYRKDSTSWGPPSHNNKVFKKQCETLGTYSTCRIPKRFWVLFS